MGVYLQLISSKHAVILATLGSEKLRVEILGERIRRITGGVVRYTVASLYVRLVLMKKFGLVDMEFGPRGESRPGGQPGYWFVTEEGRDELGKLKRAIGAAT